jgi:hypothetical protein
MAMIVCSTLMRQSSFHWQSQAGFLVREDIPSPCSDMDALALHTNEESVLTTPK